MKLLVLSPEKLRKGEKPDAMVPPNGDTFPKLEDAFAMTLANALNAHIHLSRVNQLAKRDRSQRPPDIAEHYVLPVTPGLLSDSVTHVVIEAFRSAGWKYSRLLVGNIVIAREPYEVGPARGQKRLPLGATH